MPRPAFPVRDPAGPKRSERVRRFPKPTATGTARPPNSTCLCLTTGPGAVRRLLQDLSGHLREAGCPAILIEDATIVLAEILNNVEEHAYAGRAGQPVAIKIWLAEDGASYIVEDEGIPLSGGCLPASVMPAADPDLPGSLPEGGFGLPLVRRLARDLRYERREGRNRLRFRVPMRD